MTGACSTVLIYDSFGPYHLARLSAVRSMMDVTGLEVGSLSSDYSWFTEDSSGFVETLFPGVSSDQISLADLRSAMDSALDRLNPIAVAVPGWSSPAALSALLWAWRHSRTVVLMSDSTALDAPRRAPLEWVKTIIVKGCDAGFVSGSRSADYLASLGMPRDRMFDGYDVVDNEHFVHGASAARKQDERLRGQLGLPPRYLLFVGRLMEKKNLGTLMKAYARYASQNTEAERIVHLLIVGEGPLAARLKALRAELNLGDLIHFYGHADYPRLPTLYGLAEGFVLPSMVEQWGLVVNEAIASGLPVLVSNRAGAAADIVVEGENGFSFSPNDIVGLTKAIEALVSADKNALGLCSRQIANEWGLARFAKGLQHSVDKGIEAPRRAGILTRAVANFLVRFHMRQRDR